MNSQQFQQFVNLLLGAGGPLAALLIQWGVPEGTITQIAQLVLIVVPPAYAWWRSHHQNSDSGLLVAASNVPGAAVTVDPQKASPASVQAAKDPTTNVEMKAPTP